MSASRDELLHLLRLVEITEPSEIDCGQFLAEVSGYLERLGPDGMPPPGYEHLVHHLRLCPECLEEFEALYEAFRSERP